MQLPHLLLIDAGNSRIKWVNVQNGAWARQGSVETGAWDALRLGLASLPVPQRIVVSNVAGAEAAQQLRAACAAWPCELEFIRANPAQCGVRNTYADTAQLGSDRWAALIAAWQQVHGACLVVNCGTATTIDTLSETGEFMGGIILPGMGMMRRSLATGTAQLGDVHGSWQIFPRTTADAVASGVIQATAGAICLQHKVLALPAAPCVLGGGAAGELEQYLDLPLLRVEDMVLRGLQSIAQERGQG